MSKITELASVQINSTGALTVVLSEPDDMPASVIIHFPAQPTVIDPARFGDIAAALVKMFSEAHIALAAVRRQRRL
jgi:hypothetical protein